MKTNIRSSNAKIWLGAVASLALLLLANTASAQWSGSPNIYYNSGNVGIGTATPTERLHVYNSAGHTYILADSPNANHSVFSLRSAGTETGAFYRPAGTNDVRIWSGADRITVLNSNGNVGIGTTSPSTNLEVDDTDSDAYALRLHRASNGAAWGVGQTFSLLNSSSAKKDYAAIFGAITTNTAGAEDGFLDFYTVKTGTLTNQMRITSTGNVGIGTTAPLGPLDVRVSPNGYAGLLINYSSNSYLRAGATSGDVHIGDVITRNVLIGEAGGVNVGIGSGTPTTPLHVFGNGTVTGNLTVGGNIAAKYQDLAEWVPTSEQLPAGTVVVLDSTRSNQVIRSTQGYDTRVAGVISAQPGITLGEGGEGKVLVATTGRVLVNVDATNAPIHIGDLLVTSDVPGMAMKSEPIKLGGRLMHMPGTLIGKALEPLEKGSGKILVLLSLQ